MFLFYFWVHLGFYQLVDLSLTNQLDSLLESHELALDPQLCLGNLFLSLIDPDYLFST